MKLICERRFFKEKVIRSRRKLLGFTSTIPHENCVKVLSNSVSRIFIAESSKFCSWRFLPGPVTDKSLCKYYLFYFKILKITASATFTGTDFSEEAGLALSFPSKFALLLSCTFLTKTLVCRFSTLESKPLWINILHKMIWWMKLKLERSSKSDNNNVLL